MTLENYRQYLPAVVSSKYHEAGDKNGVEYALRNLAKKVVRGDYEGFLKSTLTTDEGIKEAINTYTKKYNDAKRGIKIEEFYNDHKDLIDGLNEKTQKAIKEKVSKHEGKEYGKIQDEIQEAEWKVRNPRGASEEDRRKYEELRDKYGALMVLFGSLEEYDVSIAREGIEREKAEGTLEQLAKAA